MNKNEIEVGGKHEAKTGSRWIGVTILGPAKTGWNAVSDMGKPVKVKDAKNLRPAKDAVVEPTETADETTPADPAPPKRVRATKARPAKTPAGDASPTKMSCLDAAAAILKAHGNPMQTKAMIDAMHSQGLWSSDAPTPAATLYSAILREMKTKGDKARFKKTDRGHFGLNA